ncbi:CRAL/TRIO domain-containing protein [Peniophora sp. CONT]|nr:CRAL/TRIO domain-containing protein [Peniophora sp. CONT]
MDCRTALASNHDELLKLYEEHTEDIEALRLTLSQRILPNIQEDGLLDSQAELARARNWLEDDVSTFKMFKRHKFTSPFALEAMRDTLLWRSEQLRSRPQPSPFPRGLLYCLRPPASDFLGQPVVIIRPSGLQGQALSTETLQGYLIHALEMLRQHLVQLNSTASARPQLQALVILDMTDISVRTVNVDLLSWYAREAMPRFPGMLAGVLVVNTGWAHSGAWSVLRHVLPDAALRRVFFLSRQQLHAVIQPSSLPKDYGGELPLLKETPDILDFPGSPDYTAVDTRPPSPPMMPVRPPPRLSPRSSYNPYWGYPVHSGNFQSTPGRRRKRDLVRTLALLWWERWRVRATAGLVVTFVAAVILVLRSRGRLGGLARMLRLARP